MRRLPSFDMPLLLCILTLVGLGFAFVYTASYPKAMTMAGNSGDPFFFAGRQMIFAGAGLVAMLACMFIPLSILRKLAGVIIGIILILLVLVLVIGTAKHGNKAWIDFGFFQFQPSELVKVAMVLTLPAFLIAHPGRLTSWRGLLSGPLWYLIVPVALVIAQEDLGTALTISMATIILLAVAGTPFRLWGVPLLTFFGVVTLLVIMMIKTGHGGGRVDRVEAWLSPFNAALSQSYQPRQSLIAVGSGGLWGRGFCMSRQKWFYLPAAQNDYILATIAEELGFLKLLLLLFVPYLFLAVRGFSVAHRAPDEYAALVAAGCTVMLMTQALINMAVVTNLIPCMGINLPFISYGGTSLIASMMMAGLLLNVSALNPLRRQPRSANTVAQPAGA